MAGRDVIGDVHGHAGTLLELLAELGYRKAGAAHRHPEGRTAVFLMDLIDRGPRQVEAVSVVRRMIDAGTAVACMANHEFNAVMYATVDPRDPDGRHMRRRRGNVVTHHRSYIDQVGGADSPLHREHAAFFASLPLWLDFGDLRCVHACWHQPSVDLLAAALGPGGAIGAGRFAEAMSDAALFDAAEKLCKGVEVDLPPGVSFLDAQGSRRRRGRLAWWVDAPAALADAVDEEGVAEALAGLPPPSDALIPDDGGSPVLFGHYWRKGLPRLTGGRRACLDFSVARGGWLCAYRHDGERGLDAAKLVAVPARD